MREIFDTIVIGGSQAGLGTGYYLKQQGRNFVILDASEHIGDAWRNRWDSLRLFTPNRYNRLPGMPFPGSATDFPTKDEMADYLQSYAKRFDLPVRLGVRVDSLAKQDGRFVVTAGDQTFEADNIVVAMGNFQHPYTPDFASELDPGIVQMHSTSYRNLSQLQEGAVLVVGAGNSGVEIAVEAAGIHPTYLSGDYPPHIPFNIESTLSRLLLSRIVLGFVFYHVLSVKTPIGRKMRENAGNDTGPLLRTRPHDVAAANVEKVSRVVGIQDGQPVLEDGRILEVKNVVWCTGYRPGYAWIKLPIFTEDHLPRQFRGVVRNELGLYFVGVHFQTALASGQVNGIRRDAQYIADTIAKRAS